ncbi:MAG TPA: thiol-disulfide oxidoreductase, partial [Gammaproteobacteria bacterium]|nr:thiol-disulfide oxidoreductase [Gammaproteobacteria bacterium]
DDEFEFMFDQGFTDGLPVVPPTPERVLRMLSGTKRDAQEVVATMAPNMAKVTVEKIAINAVLAGCRPEYLPVVIAAVEAVCTDDFNIHGVMV